MRKVAICAAMVWLVVLASGCFDPEPGEISVRAVKNGRQQVCAVQVFNAKGNQIQERHTDFNGLVYVKQLTPGEYTLKFVDNRGNYYPAVKTVNVREGDSVILDVELTEAPAVPEA